MNNENRVITLIDALDYVRQASNYQTQKKAIKFVLKNKEVTGTTPIRRVFSYNSIKAYLHAETYNGTVEHTLKEKRILSELRERLKDPEYKDAFLKSASKYNPQMKPKKRKKYKARKQIITLSKPLAAEIKIEKKVNQDDGQKEKMEIIRMIVMNTSISEKTKLGALKKILENA